MTQLTPSEIQKWYAVLLGIRTGSSNTIIAECLGVNLRTVQRILKELDESNIDYVGVQSDHQDLRLNTEAYIMGRVCCPDSVGCLMEDIISGNRTLHHVAQAGESNHGCQTISATALTRVLTPDPRLQPAWLLCVGHS